MIKENNNYSRSNFNHEWKAVICGVASVFVFCLLFVTNSHAQATASVSGLVSDTSGAAVADAAVTITNAQTGFTRTATSNGDGLYTLPLIPPGEYSISATREGFQKKLISNIVLQVGQRAGIDVKLDVGEVTQQIEVTGEAPLVQTQSAQIGDVIEGRRVENMPLNGRQFLQLALLAPNVSQSPGGNSQGGGTQGPTLNINGGRQDLNRFTIDGVNATNPNSNSLVISPNVDAIAEFKVETSLAGIQSGGANGGYVNIVTKSGTNSFHGDLFEFVRNDKLNAHNFFDKPGAPVPPYKQNQFGGTFGGPIRKNKTFFFGSYESLRIRQTQTALFSVPTTDFRGGDFSVCAANPTLCKVPIDPTTGLPFPFNKIPSNRINSASTILQKLYPLPTNTDPTVLSGNFLGQAAAPTTSSNFTVRVDHQLTSKDTIFARFLYLQRTDLNPSTASAGVGGNSIATGGVPGFGSTANTTDRNAGATYTRTISSNTVLQVSGGWDRPGVFNTLYQPGYAGTDFGTLTGIQGLSTDPKEFGAPTGIISGFNNLGGGSVGGSIAESREFNVNVTHIHGNHTIVFGMNQTWHLINLLTTANLLGSFQFTGFLTGNAYADFLLGVPFSAGNSAGSLSTMYWRAHQYGFYVGDTWHVTPRFVLELGLRNDYQQPYIELNGRQATFSKNPLQFIVPGTNGHFLGDAYTAKQYVPLIEALIPIVTNDQAGYPRGLITENRHNLEPRIGFSWTPFSNQKTVIRGGYGIYTGLKPFWSDASAVQIFQPYQVRLSVSNTVSQLPIQTVLTGAGGLQLSAFGVAKDWPDSWTENFDLSVQHSISPNLLIDLTYTGSRSHHLPSADYFNIPTTLGNLATRPVTIFSAGSVLLQGEGIANYNSGTIRVTKRLSYGLSFSGAFTWARGLDDWNIPTGSASSSLNQSNDPKQEYAVSNFDINKRLIASYVWQTPFGTGRKYASHGLAGKLLGWDLSGITTIQSGLPFTINTSGNACGSFIGTQCRPDQILDDPSLPHGQRSTNLWFNTAAFQIQSTFRNGTASRDSVRAPGIVNFDESLAKDIPIHENMALRFQFDAFNLFNNPHFGIPQRLIDGAGFGKIFSAAAPRLLQFGLKLSF